MHTTCMQVPEVSRRGRPFKMDLELQVAGSYTMWVLGTNPRSSARAVNALNC